MFARIRILALAALVAVPTLAAAQSGGTTAPKVRSAPVAGPRLEATATAVRRPARSSATQSSAAAAQRQNLGKPVALMIVGGAAFVAGALIGGDVGVLMMVGGAVIGLIGLYQYLQ